MPVLIKCARFRFYAELNDFLPAERRMVAFAHIFVDAAPVKDMVESLGVPHTEIDLILVNGQSVDFSYIVRDGDRISVYPVFEALDITPLIRLRPLPLREPRFVLDTHLGRLAGYLRMAGFDTLYGKDCDDEELARISRDAGRILLTRDIGLLKRGMVTHGYYIRETAVRRQFPEVIRRFDLSGATRPFTRCLRCNAMLDAVARAEIAAQLPPRTAEFYDEFRRCPECRRVYWKGGHYRRMREFLASAGQLS
ncbi:MAG: Mut7-C RNAse domain-containing protein [Bryobacteraceae bacterium]|jgi:uncharacterized protein with PIN domain